MAPTQLCLAEKAVGFFYPLMRTSEGKVIADRLSFSALAHIYRDRLLYLVFTMGAILYVQDQAGMISYGSVVVAGILALALPTWLVTALFAWINELVLEEDRREAYESEEDSGGNEE
jgi:hypothetical protein